MFKHFLSGVNGKIAGKFILQLQQTHLIFRVILQYRVSSKYLLHAQDDVLYI